MKAIEESDLLNTWYYLITIAGVGTAFFQIIDTVPESKVKGICNAIQHVLNDWNPNAYDTMADYTNYVKRLVDKEVNGVNAVGGWIWINLEKSEGANEELINLALSLKLIGPTGFYILAAFKDWWKPYYK